MVNYTTYHHFKTLQHNITWYGIKHEHDSDKRLFKFK